MGSASWATVSPTYYNNGGGWTRASIDLSAYAGRAIQVAFHFTSTSSYNDPGWYVDDVALVTGAPVFNNPEGFESGLGDWYPERGIWQVGAPTWGPGGGYTGTKCAGTVLAGNYPDNADSRLVSPAFVVPAASASPRLRFWHWFAISTTAGYTDTGTVEVKPVGSNNWITVSSAYSGNSGGWTRPSIALSSYAEKTIQVAFHFTSTSSYNDPGWYVDDVSIQSFGAPYILASLSSQTKPVGTTATFLVGASGAQPLSYQWRFNSVAIAGATHTDLNLINVQLNQTGYYDVVVTNASGSVTSAPARLDVAISFAGSDVGDASSNGGFGLSGGVFTVWGDGEDIEDTADAFHFAHQSLTGDGQIVARLLSLQGGGEHAEAGVMMRESLASGSRHVFLAANSEKLAKLRRRLASDGYSVENAHPGTNYGWLRLMRMGNTFVGHCSTNGTNWEYVWFTTVNMSSQLEVGLAVTAHSYGLLATGMVDNVSLGTLTPLSGVWPEAGPQIYLGGERPGAMELLRVGGFKALVGGVAGDRYAVKSSANVAAPSASWLDLGTVTNTYGVVPFTDAQALTNGIRFYRATVVVP